MTDETPKKTNKGGRPKKRTLKARGDPKNAGRKPSVDLPNRDHFLLEDFADLRKRFVWNSEFAIQWFEMMGYTLMNKRDMANALGYSEDHLHKKFAEFPQLQNAYDRGSSKVKTQVIRAMVIEAKCGNVKAAELVLERRFREEWGKKLEVTGNQAITYIIAPEDADCL